MNPRRPGSDGSGAFRVNLHSGAWGDFAGTDKGGDLVSLFAYVNNCSQADACRSVAKQLGVAPERSGGEAPRPRAAPAKRDGEQVYPAPADAPAFEPALHHFRMGKPSRWWDYRDAAGGLLMVVARYETPSAEDPTAKEIMPYTLWRRSSGLLTWAPGALPKPWPLYRLDEIARRPGAVVVVCEGEKAALAAEHYFPSYVATTAPSGWQKAPLADWSPLAGRQVILWPDHDWQGLGYAHQAAEQLAAVGATVLGMLSYEWSERALATTGGGTVA